MQKSNQIPQKIAQNRDLFRSEIRSKKNNDLFKAKRLKFQYVEKEVLFSDDHLITQLLETCDLNEIISCLEELRKRSCEFEKNEKKPNFLQNERLFLLIPILVKFLDNHELQYNSCWILINLLIGDTNLIHFCIKSGLLQAFLRIIEKGDATMREQALWGIANMAGDSPEVLMIIVQENSIEKVWTMLRNMCLTIEISKNVLWFLTNVLSKEYYKGDLVLIVRMVGVIIENNCFEEQLFESCTMVLDKVSKKQPVLEKFDNCWSEISMILVKIIYYFTNEYEKLQENTIAYSLNFIGMFLLGKDEMIEQVTKLNVGLIYQKTMRHIYPKIRQATFLALGNAFCSDSDVIEFFFKNTGSIFPFILETIQNDSHFKVKREAIICLSNLVSMSHYERISELLELGVIEAISSILDIYDPDLLLNLLGILEELFTFGERLRQAESSSENPAFFSFKQTDGLKKLEYLLQHSNEKIQKKAIELLRSCQNDLENLEL